MKKLILFILLIPWFCFADTNPYILGSGVESGGTSGFVGNNTGTDTGVNSGANDVAYQTFEATTSGTISYVHCRLTSHAGDFNVAIYNSSGDKIAESNLTTAGTSPEIMHFALDTSISITSGLDYTLLVGAETDTYWLLSSAATTGASLPYAVPTTVADTMPSTLPTGGSSSSTKFAHIWADNSPDGT